MIHRNAIYSGFTTSLVLIINVIVFGRLSWCNQFGSQILYLEETVNASFDSFETHYSDESYTINTVGCVIPAINIEDVSIKKYINETNKQKRLCKNYDHRLLESNQTHIWTVKENYKHFEINDEHRLECCYQSFHRPITSWNVPRRNVDDRITYLGCIIFHKSIEVNNEFVRVSCYYEGKHIYKQYFIFTPKKQFAYNRDNPFKSVSNQSYNVLIMGIGSMSRQNFYRTMPNTLELLRKYNMVELKGYNTVAGDTFQNMIPVLVGMNTSEIDRTCWPHSWTTLDSCPFIWERFKDVGYYTAFVEDTSEYGMFNRDKFGFRGSPTDYYLHPFIHESETLTKTKIHKVRQNRRNTISYHEDPEPVPVCMGDKYYYEVLLDYVDRITTTLNSSKLFGVFWETSMSHDYLNEPLNMDKAYVALMKKMESTGYLNRTILIILSDHGMDIGNISKTKQGRIEQRLPFVFIVTPPDFQTEFRLAHHNLNVNKGRLTTPFDVHKTLIDLIDLSDINESEILKRSTEFYTHNRGISLFLQIPRNRTCEMAGIKDRWCTCYNDIKLPPSAPIIIQAVKFLTNHVNEILAPYPECLKLIVDDIIIAKEMLPVYEHNKEWRDFNVIVRMAPGGGIFETILRHYNQTWIIIDHIKRLNFPGFRTLCVTDASLKLFCFCK